VAACAFSVPEWSFHAVSPGAWFGHGERTKGMGRVLEIFAGGVVCVGVVWFVTVHIATIMDGIRIGGASSR
jgi:hypothetical protein